MKSLILITATLVLFSLPITGHCKEPGRSKVIDFEGELVEGMNKKPLDSLSQISENERNRKKSHLYRVRKGYRNESTELLREMRHLQ